MIHYLISQRKAEEVVQFAQELVKALPNAETEIMNGVEYLINKGKEQGVQQGMQTGWQRCANDVIAKCVAKGHSVQEIADIVDLPVKQIKQIIGELTIKE